MTKASDNAFPSVLITEGTEPSAPAAGKQRIYIDSTSHHLKRTDSSGTDVDLEAGTGTLSPTTIELGHASDTTLARVSAGVVAIEGTNIVKAGAATSSGLTMATARLLGRTTASSGAIEEVTVGTGLSFAAGTLASTTSGSSPGWIGDFYGTTDATHFYWDGNDLASFTTQTVTGSATWVEGTNLASVLLSNQTSDDVAAVLIAQTISTGDAWTVPINLGVPFNNTGGTNTGNRSIGILMTDGTGTTANCVIGHMQLSNDLTSPSSVIVGRTGTLTSVTTAPWVTSSWVYPSGWLYLKLVYSAANTFQLLVSPNGVQYSALGEADISKTMTPTHVGICGWLYNTGSAIGTFGPLKKV